MANRLLPVLVLTQGLSGLIGGYGLVVDPSGRALGLPLSWLATTPFSDYLVPGLILLIALGALPAVVSWGAWKGRRWGWYGSVAVGAGLVAWILVEIAMIGYKPSPPLQLIYGLLGLGILALASTGNVRRCLLAGGDDACQTSTMSARSDPSVER